MTPTVDELRAILAAYKQVKDASWPKLHPAMAERAAHWPGASAAELQAEITNYLAESAAPGVNVRVFWKLCPKFLFGGCNQLFARDAGFPDPATMVGLDDFDPRLPWRHQAAKYRADDESVFKSGHANLDIMERQQSSTGITWVRAGKAPIRTATGVVGILGMYEVLDAETGRKLFAERHNKKKPHA